MAIIGIVAIAENYAIGKNGKLPWHYSADLKFFKRVTTGNAVLMGSNTWRSIGKPLPKRLNIVISRSLDIEDQPGVLLMRSNEEVVTLNRFLGCDLFIIGGAQTYQSFAGIIDKWIVTEIPINVEDADVFMPRDFLDGFALLETDRIDPEILVKTFEREN